MMRRHELDPVSLIFGFAFTALGLLFLIGRADDALRLRWIWPLLLLTLGAGILLDIARGRGRTAPAGEDDQSPEADEVVDSPEQAVDSREQPG